MSLTVSELCKKYNLEVESLDDVTFKVNSTHEINLDEFMEDIGNCSILVDDKIHYKRVSYYSCKIGRLYAFTLEPVFNDTGIKYRHELIDKKIVIYTATNRILKEDSIDTIWG